MLIYEVLYNPMYYESAAQTLSIHKTLAGAYKAMRKHRWNACVEHREDRLRFGNDGRARQYQYDAFKWWGIRKRELREQKGGDAPMTD